jgi:hypothetical protein
MERRPANPRLDPANALLSPSWIAALALLALNDHWLKTAGLLPGWLTGKLSDFAGLYVAPALLAALLCVRTRRALLLCHAAVGVVFSAINVDVGAAELAVKLMRLLGFEWRVVADLPDLIALPALAGAWFGLMPAMQRRAPARGRRVVQHVAAATGLLLCMATSDVDEFTAFQSGFEAPHLHNMSRDTVTVLVRPLRQTVLLDCDAIAADPGARLPDSAFDVATVFELGPHENIGLPVNATTQPRCYAVRLGGAGFPPAIVFWTEDAELSTQIPFTYDSEEGWQLGAIGLKFEHGVPSGYRDEGGFVFELEPPSSEIDPSCAPANEAARPAISTELRTGTVQLLSVDEGPDGCIGLRTRPARQARPPSPPPADEDAGVEPSDEDAGAPVEEPTQEEPTQVDPGAGDELVATGADAYVCVPRGMFPFRSGDIVHIEVGANGPGAVRISQEDAAGLPATELVIAPLNSTFFTSPIDLEVTRDELCPYTLREGCAQTAAAAQVDAHVGSEHVTLRAGDSEHLRGNGVDVELALPVAQYRVLLDAECAPGNPLTGGDAVVVAVLRYEENQQ